MERLIMYLDSVVQELFGVLQAPLIVLDADMNLVAHSVHEDVEHDAMQVRMIVSRRGTTGAIASFEQYSVKYSTAPVRLPGRDGGRGHIVVTLRSAGQPTGYLTFPDRYSGDIPADHLAVVESTARTLGDGLRDRMLGHRRGKEHVRQLMEDMLSDDDYRHDYAVRELQEGRLVPPAPEYTLVLVSPSAEPGAVGPEALHTLESAAGPASDPSRAPFVGTVIRGEGVLVVPAALDSAGLRDLLAGHVQPHFRLAAGGPVEDLTTIRRSMRQARIVLEGIRRDPARGDLAASWVDLGSDRLLFQLPFGSMDPTDLPGGVQRLLGHGNPRLLETVQAYLDAGGNAVRASRRLHVHRSTLYYRLDQAAEVADVDLNDGTVRQELHLALRVAALLGLTDRPVS
jgi:hypothetical protein